MENEHINIKYTLAKPPTKIYIRLDENNGLYGCNTLIFQRNGEEIEVTNEELFAKIKEIFKPKVDEYE